MRSAVRARPLLGSLVLCAAFGAACGGANSTHENVWGPDASDEDDASTAVDASVDAETDASTSDASVDEEADASLSDASVDEEADASLSDASAEDELDAGDASLDDTQDASVADASEPPEEEPGPTPVMPPLVTVGKGADFVLGGSPVALLSTVQITDADSTQLGQLQLRIATLAHSGDTLSYSAPLGSPITAEWTADTYSLSLSGKGTLAEYEAAALSVTFSATRGAGLVRGITIAATDAEGIGAIAPGFVTVTVQAAPPSTPP